MDVLKPDFVWVDGRCYRSYEGGIATNSSNASMTPYVEESYQPIYEDEMCDADIEIVPHGSTKFKHTFHIPKCFFPYIIGAKHATRKRLETETKTSIQIPKLGEDGDIVITGPDQRGIATARRRIDLIVESSRHKIRPTHFLSVPLNDGRIIMKFNAFKADVLRNYGSTCRGIEEEIFQVPSKLHLTFGVLVLLDDVERNKAIEGLQYAKEHIIKPIIEEYGPINIQLKGVDIMNDDPTEVKVLYAKVENPDNGLQQLANEVAKYFCTLGFLKPTKGKTDVSLHATLMNTKFKQDDDESYKSYDTFDATPILEAHKDTYFGEITLKSIHLSQRHTIGSNGYYQSTAEINISRD